MLSSSAVWCALVDNLQAELDDAWLEGAGDLSATVGNSSCDGGDRHRGASPEGLRRGALGSADGAGKVEVGVVEDVVELCAEFDLQALEGRVELLVEGEVSLVEGRSAARIAAGIAEGTEHIAGSILDRGKNKGVEVDVVDVSRIGRAVAASLGYLLAGDVVGAILIGATVGCRDLSRNSLRTVGAVGN